MLKNLKPTHRTDDVWVCECVCHVVKSVEIHMLEVFGCVCTCYHIRDMVCEEEEEDEETEVEEDNGMVNNWYYVHMHVHTHTLLNACLQTHFWGARTLCYLPQSADS